MVLYAPYGVDNTLFRAIDDECQNEHISRDNVVLIVVACNIQLSARDPVEMCGEENMSNVAASQ